MIVRPFFISFFRVPAYTCIHEKFNIFQFPPKFQGKALVLVIIH